MFNDNWDEWVKRPGVLVDGTTFVVDVRGVCNRQAAVQIFWNVLTGPEFQKLEEEPVNGSFNGSLDALMEVVADFLESRWGRTTKIYVVGADSLEALGKGYFAGVKGTLAYAQYFALVTRLRSGATIEEIEPHVYKTHIEVFWK
jgi:hypothetical protein